MQDQAQVVVTEMPLVQRGLDVRWQQRAAAEEARHRCGLARLAIVLCKKKKKKIKVWAYFLPNFSPHWLGDGEFPSCFFFFYSGFP